MVERLIELTLGAPPGETTHWTSRAMGKVTGLAISTVQKIWRAHGLAPHRLRTFKLSRDPQFAAKVQDVVGLYVAPPAHAVVLSVDEKSQIQALDRTQPGLPMKKGRAGTHHPRLHPQRHHHPVRRPQRPGRLGDRPVHAAAPAPGVPALPQPSRARRPGRPQFAALTLMLIPSRMAHHGCGPLKGYRYPLGTRSGVKIQSAARILEMVGSLTP